MLEIPNGLAPEIDVGCAVCGEAAGDEICSAAELAAQRECAQRFHLSRLRRRSRGALQERAHFTHDYPTSLIACARCGLVYRSPRPRARALLGAYEGERYAPERLPQMIASQRTLFRPRARALARRLRPGARVLEVGSFVGGFLLEARHVGLTAVGLDPSEQLSELCRRSGLRVLQTTLEELTRERDFEPFDALAIWNTFDQIPRPRATLAAAARALRPNGLLLLRFPHGEYFRWSVASRRLPLLALAWNNLLGFPYLHGYGERSLELLVREFGLTPGAVTGDTLGIVADRSYARWARLEERALKTAQRARFTRDPSRAPWLDVVLRASPSA